MLNDKQTNLFWVDLEMTGLDPNTDVITEIGCVITNPHLEVIAEGPDLVIHHPEDQLSKLSDEVNDIYNRSELKQKIRESNTGLEEAEKSVLEFVKKYCDEKMSPYCGNTVSTDKQFIKKYMPDLYGYLHYRVIDVSTIKELAKRWYPKLPLFEKAEKHRAMEDIKESIAELKYYRDKVFVKQI